MLVLEKQWQVLIIPFVVCSSSRRKNDRGNKPSFLITATLINRESVVDNRNYILFVAQTDSYIKVK